MKRSARVVMGAVATVVMTAGAVHFLAVTDMNRERRARRYLRDTLYSEVHGKGDPIVFLPGLQGSTRFWDHSFDSLSASHRLIFVDELGFGRSPWPEESLYTLADQLAALRRTLVALHATGNVTLVAHSFGTVLAAYYASRYPKEVHRLALLGTPVFNSEQEGKSRIKQLSTLAAAFTFNRPLAIAACTAMCAFRPFLRRVLPLLARDRPPEVVRDSVLHDLTSVDGSVGILLHQPIAIPVRALGTAITFIHGTRDAVTSVAEVETLAQSSGARFVAVDSDHHQYLSQARDLIVSEITRP